MAPPPAEWLRRSARDRGDTIDFLIRIRARFAPAALFAPFARFAAFARLKQYQRANQLGGGKSAEAYWDENGKLARLFGVREIPTYVLPDAEGIEQLRVNGAGFHEARNLSAEIDRQITLSTTPRP